MTENNLIQQMEARGVKPTALRLLIYRSMLEQQQAFSLSSLEEQLDSVDKSTLSRTITLFHKHLLIHSIDDGSGSTKYSVCSADCTCELKDQHLHFYCNSCKKTFCQQNISIPPIQLPSGFILESVNFVLKGLCDNCSNKFAS